MQYTDIMNSSKLRKITVTSYRKQPEVSNHMKHAGLKKWYFSEYNFE